MAEAVGSAMGVQASEDNVGAALRNAIVTGLIAFLLFVVVLGLKTENAQDKLALVNRLGVAASIAVLAAVARFLMELFVWRGGKTRVDAGPVISPDALLMILRVTWLIGGLFFILPIARESFAAGVSGLFPTEIWQGRARITLDLVIFILLAIFVVVTAMLAMSLLKRAALLVGIGRKRGATDLMSELGSLFGPALLLVAIALPFLVAGPQQRYALDTAIQVLTYIMLGWGLNVVVGLAGLLDLGYVAFYAVGAYSYALLSTTFGWSFWICLPLAGILAALWGIILGFPVLRLRGDYLAIVTLAFGEIIRVVLLNWYHLTGGPNGISRIPRVSFFGLSFDRNAEPSFHSFFGIAFDPVHRIMFMYYVILVLALMVNFATQRLRKLPIGRAWEALREDEIACRSLGINTVTTKLTAFSIGAMFAGFAGSFFATRQGFISPESFTFHESALVLAIVVLGGLGSQLGIVIAAVALIGSSEFFRDLEEYRMLIFGLSMVAIMLWRPRGLVSSRTPSVVLKESRAISGSLVKEGHG